MKVELKNVASVFNGKTPSKAEQRDVGFPVLKIKDIDENGFFKGQFDCFVDQRFADKLLKKQVQVGDNLILNAAHNSKYVGSKKCFVSDDFAGALATGEWTIVRPNQDKALPKFLYFILNTAEFQFELQNVVKGIHLYPKDLNEIKIFCPSLEEQKRIVRELDVADALRQKRKQVIALLDDYLKAVFLEMFGDPVTNSKGWEKQPLSFFGSIITGNTPPRNDVSNYSSSFIEWIKTDNIIADRIYLTSSREHLSEIGLKRARYVMPGAVLVACIAGSIESIGRAAIADRKVSFNQQINAIQPNGRINTFFLYWLFKISKQYVQNHATKGMKRILTKGSFEKILMILPPTDLQNKFAEIVEKIDLLKESMLEQSDDLGSAIKATMQANFSHQ